MIKEKESHAGVPDIRKSVEITIRIGMLIFLFYWCYTIIHPFLDILLWSVIFAVSLFPVYQKVLKRLKGRRVLAAIMIVLFLVVVFLLPAVFFAKSLFDGIYHLKSHALEISQINVIEVTRMEQWPYVGKFLSKELDHFAQNIDVTLKEHIIEIRHWSSVLITSAMLTMVAYIKFFISIVLSGVLLVHAGAGSKMALSFSEKLLGKRGGEFAKIAERTVRLVLRGIIGVALIQSTLMGIGFELAGVPGTGLLVLIGVILGVIQIGIVPVMVPVVVYMFLKSDMTTAVCLLIWCILISPVDNILKPILLGRGADVPMAVIFIGAIGGFLHSGIIGLFKGAIIFSIGYKLFIFWVEGGNEDELRRDPSDYLEEKPSIRSAHGH
ncbi:MAG: AI-2E family transporter [Verrucomicrobiota bacterium]|nr:AI-2E family transporter [Verrucomicrobiota bacterium]